MKEAGFDNTPTHRYIQLTDVIWRATRIVLDVRLHRGEIGFEAAVDQLVDETGFERPAALAEVKRYTGTPTYQLSYLYGRHMIEALRRDVEVGRTGLQPQAVPRHPPVRRDHARLLRPAPVRPLRGLRARGGRQAGLAAVVLLVTACNGGGPGGPPPRAGVPDGSSDGDRGGGHPGGRDHGDRGHHPGRVHHDLQTQAAPIATANFVASPAWVVTTRR